MAKEKVVLRKRIAELEKVVARQDSDLKKIQGMIDKLQKEGKSTYIADLLCSESYSEYVRNQR